MFVDTKFGTKQIMELNHDNHYRTPQTNTTIQTPRIESPKTKNDLNQYRKASERWKLYKASPRKPLVPMPSAIPSKSTANNTDKSTFMQSNSTKINSNPIPNVSIGKEPENNPISDNHSNLRITKRSQFNKNTTKSTETKKNTVNPFATINIVKDLSSNPASTSFANLGKNDNTKSEIYTQSAQAT